MKDYAQIIGKMTSAPWMITPEALKMILEIMESHMSGTLTQEDIRARMSAIDSKGAVGPKNQGGLGVLSLSGPIFPKANLMTEMSGATSIEQFRSDFRGMLADDNVHSILLDVDSPGGYSEQIPEMAAEIFDARGTKPIYALANAHANSAAYYIASQADKMFATPSGQLGSIGTYTVHTDASKKHEMEGIKNTVISAGRFKAVGVEPLTAEGRQYMQNHVDSINNDFVDDVARGRGVESDVVRRNYGEGGIVTPRQALESGMIDGIATFDEVVQSMTQGGSIASTVSVAAHSNINIVNTNSTSTKQSYDADKEHSEPGTGLGGEPEPREAPEKGDRAIEGGWRRDPPPIAYEEVEEMNRELLVALAGRLGIEFDDDTSDEDLSGLVTAKVDEIVVPLSEATQDAQKQQDFLAAYPEQASQLARLQLRDRENEARQFAEGFQSFADDSKKGFSNVVRTKIEDAHMKIAERRMTHEDLNELLTSASAKDGVVEYGEKGSARTDEDKAQVRAGATPQEVRQQMAELVRTAMTEDSMDRKAALKHVAAQNPELFKAYIES